MPKKALSAKAKVDGKTGVGRAHAGSAFGKMKKINNNVAGVNSVSKKVQKNGESNQRIDASPQKMGETGEDTPAPLAPAGFIRLSGPIEHDSIVNGDGLRAVIWTQGCRQNCKGCQNPETWDLAGGMLVKIFEVEERLSALKGQAGLTFCGGEPFLQPEACREIAEFCRHELGWNVWSFTGFCYEDILATAVLGRLENQWARGAFVNNDTFIPNDTHEKIEYAQKFLKTDTPEIKFLKSLDALIDGPFVLAERDLSVRFRGSRNQRLLFLQDGEITKTE